MTGPTQITAVRKTDHSYACAECVWGDVGLEFGLDNTRVAVRASDTSKQRKVFSIAIASRIQFTYPQITRTFDPAICLFAR